MMAERLLVVDDEPQVLRGLTAALEAAGYDVIGAGTAAGALEAAALRPPDAVVLDLRLPDGSGVEVCRRLREWSQAPVVVVSAVDEEDEKIAALDAGADDYVTKPYAGCGPPCAARRPPPASRRRWASATSRSTSPGAR